MKYVLYSSTTTLTGNMVKIQDSRVITSHYVLSVEKFRFRVDFIACGSYLCYDRLNIDHTLKCTLKAQLIKSQDTQTMQTTNVI